MFSLPRRHQSNVGSRPPFSRSEWRFHTYHSVQLNGAEDSLCLEISSSRLFPLFDSPPLCGTSCSLGPIHLWSLSCWLSACLPWFKRQWCTRLSRLYQTYFPILPSSSCITKLLLLFLHLSISNLYNRRPPSSLILYYNVILLKTKVLRHLENIKESCILNIILHSVILEWQCVVFHYS